MGQFLPHRRNLALAKNVAPKFWGFSWENAKKMNSRGKSISQAISTVGAVFCLKSSALPFCIRLGSKRYPKSKSPMFFAFFQNAKKSLTSVANKSLHKGRSMGLDASKKKLGESDYHGIITPNLTCANQTKSGSSDQTSESPIGLGRLPVRDNFLW